MIRKIYKTCTFLKISYSPLTLEEFPLKTKQLLNKQNIQIYYGMEILFGTFFGTSQWAWVFLSKSA